MKNKDWGKGEGEGGLKREGGLINFPTLKSGGLLEWGGGGINRGFAVIIPSTNSLRRLWPKTLTLRFETRFRTIRTQACALVLKTVQYSGEDVGGCTSPPLLQLRWPAAFKYNWYPAKSLTIVVYWYWSKTWDEVDMLHWCYVFSEVHIMWLPRQKPSSYSLLKFVYATSRLRHSLGSATPPKKNPGSAPGIHRS